MIGLAVDLFAGGGGAGTGVSAALERPVDIAINHDEIALEVYRANHPKTKTYPRNVWKAKPIEVTGGRPVGVMWASPDCTHHSVAKGGKPLKKNIRALAWVVTRWAKDVRPAVIFLENVSEFRGWGPLDSAGRPIKARKGETFRRWVGQLERLGYVVDYRILDASLYGAPTRRRRLFLVARCDGRPIRWPEPTHGPGRLPLRTAAECIDWSIPCPSIFERKRPLAEKTLWRIAQGLRRFVFESPRPFIVKMKGDAHSSAPEDPLPTITAQGPGLGIALPTLVQMSHGEGAGKTKRRGRPAHPLDEPLPTQSASNDFAVMVPSIVGVGGRAGDSAPTAADAPVGTVTAKNDRALLAPTLVKVNHGKREARGEAIDEPMSTVTATQRGHAIVAPTLIQTGYGERDGQAARVPGLHKPLGTLVNGQKHALVSAFIARHFGGMVGAELPAPLHTVTARDHHSLTAATLLKMRGQCHSSDLAAPLPTIAAQGNHVAEVRAFLTAYYGEDGTSGQSVLEPLRTITAKHRLGLVTIEGTEYQVVDIGLRMLEPHELARAQFGRFAAAYDLSAARTKSKKVQLIGNSVCPEVSEALVRANVGGRVRENVA